MIESTCEACGGKVLSPDPPPKTQEEKVAFRKDWDERFMAARDADEVS